MAASLFESRNRSYFVTDNEDEEEQLHGRTIYEEEYKPLKTGLFDHLGRPVYRVKKRDPIGFRISTQ